MRVATKAAETETTTESALRLMLSYVEAECLRIGANDAARHVALAAAMMAGITAAPVAAAAAAVTSPSATAPRRSRSGLRLH